VHVKCNVKRARNPYESGVRGGYHKIYNQSLTTMVFKSQPAGAKPSATGELNHANGYRKRLTLQEKWGLSYTTHGKTPLCRGRKEHRGTGQSSLRCPTSPTPAVAAMVDNRAAIRSVALRSEAALAARLTVYYEFA
jgi:hypothetical protein